MVRLLSKHGLIEKEGVEPSWGATYTRPLIHHKPYAFLTVSFHLSVVLNEQEQKQVTDESAGFNFLFVTKIKPKEKGHCG